MRKKLSMFENKINSNHVAFVFFISLLVVALASGSVVAKTKYNEIEVLNGATIKGTAKWKGDNCFLKEKVI